MKEGLQDKLVEILTGIQGAVAKGSDFVMAQLPDIAQQYIIFGRTWSIFMVVSAILLFVGSSYVCCKYGFKNKTKNIDVQEPCIVLGIFGSLGSFVLTAYWIRELMLVWFAPKVWLLMEIASMIKH